MTHHDSALQSTFAVYTVLLTVATLIAMLNFHHLKFPVVITLSLIGFSFSAVLLLIDLVVDDAPVKDYVNDLLDIADVSQAILKYLVGMLLFAGALSADLRVLKERWRSVFLLSVLSVLIATAVLGLLQFGFVCAINQEETWSCSTDSLYECLLFASVISPTDPVAAVAILKMASTPKAILSKVQGESLFNDGTAIVCFTIFHRILKMRHAHDSEEEEEIDIAELTGELVEEIVGGLALGVLAAALFSPLVRALHGRSAAWIATNASLCLVLNITVWCNELGFSAPLACSAAGLFTQRYTLRGLDQHCREEMHTVWQFIEDAINGVLFLLIGFVLVGVSDNLYDAAWGSAGAIFFTLLARNVSVAIPITLLKRVGQRFEVATIRVLTAAGMRGAVSLALAMSLDEDVGASHVLPWSYVVCFTSVIVQGLSLPHIIRYLQEQHIIQMERRASLASAQSPSFNSRSEASATALAVVRESLSERPSLVVDSVEEGDGLGDPLLEKEV